MQLTLTTMEQRDIVLYTNTQFTLWKWGSLQRKCLDFIAYYKGMNLNLNFSFKNHELYFSLKEPEDFLIGILN